MEIYGRKIGLLFSVGAKYEIGQLDNAMDNFMRTVKTAVIMSKAYEQSQKYKNKDYNTRPLTEGEVLSLSDVEFVQLCDEVSAAFTSGNNITVEAEESKKKEDTALI